MQLFCAQCFHLALMQSNLAYFLSHIFSRIFSLAYSILFSHFANSARGLIVTNAHVIKSIPAGFSPRVRVERPARCWHAVDVVFVSSNIPDIALLLVRRNSAGVKASASVTPSDVGGDVQLTQASCAPLDFDPHGIHRQKAISEFG